MLLTVISVFCLFVLGWQLLKYVLPWLPNELKYLRLSTTMMKKFQNMKKNNVTFPERLLQLSKSHPDKPYILFMDESWTYGKMNRRVNQTARAFHKHGIRQGDRIALMMYNEPAYVAILLASMKLGAEIALINYNNRLKALIYSISIVNAKLLIIGGDDAFSEAVKGIKDWLQEMDVSVICYTKEIDNQQSLLSIIDEQPSTELESEWKPDVKFSNTACLIFTSGTTGPSKAVKMTYTKLFLGSQISVFVELRLDDIMYCSLPLYHTAGCMAGVLTALNFGVTIAMRRQFSASNFLADCRKYNVTVIQYIGETMRYICNQPPTTRDRDHKIRIAFGNGLRPDVWKTFLERFGSQIRIVEFYAATESNVSCINLCNRIGSIGTCSPILKALTGCSFVKYDWEKEEPYRTESGRCVEVGLNEPGLAIGQIRSSGPSGHCAYAGDAKLTQKKILHNVFKEGDSYYNSGDLLMRDSNYFVYFCDRVGDTFRWKGENVSTVDVGDVILLYPGVKEANVYGVKIPGNEGRAGMVALVLDDFDDLNFKDFYFYCLKYLPKYAVPIFLRITKYLEVTGTSKQIKVKLKSEGIDLDRIKEDPLFVADKPSGTYVPFTQNMLARIASNDMKF
ncbi:long-chain fatty acid transport protein 2-like [Clavelina lepadiformis]|uniref:long-chain fatty acid transport protein 2-like n=1 Tax=Clavelina lepadiformis TaxID=159417 RepID=UPI0040418C63